MDTNEKVTFAISLTFLVFVISLVFSSVAKSDEYGDFTPLMQGLGISNQPKQPMVRTYGDDQGYQKDQRCTIVMVGRDWYGNPIYQTRCQ